jgi:hypothetical protein
MYYASCNRLLHTLLVMKNDVFMDMAPYGSYKNCRFGGTCRLHLRGRKNPRAEKIVSSWLTD